MSTVNVKYILCIVFCVDRRKFLATTGSTVAAMGFVSGVGSAARQPTDTDHVLKEAEELFAECKVDKAVSAIEQGGGTVYTTRSELSKSDYNQSEANENEVGTRDASYPESDSEFRLDYWTTSSQIGATLSMHFGEVVSTAYGATKAEDAMGITFNGDAYNLDKAPELSVSPHAKEDYDWSIRASDYNPGKAGVAARVDTSWEKREYPKDVTVVMVIYLESTASSKPPVFGEYKHNNALTDGGLKSISLVPPNGGIGVELATSASTVWTQSGFAGKDA